jgi:hypothetical protein
MATSMHASEMVMLPVATSVHALAAQPSALDPSALHASGALASALHASWAHASGVWATHSKPAARPMGR